ncbi:hypothetical protein mRhiFer1_008174 [Rhinolophus ferrumequinum]|uniref:Uncharacterized protein n=1 Tax=Rhinolophus ferrumequinum TaxID=59479 RepID=A0A7J7W7Y6_RHIFE|nr:hypothetical protein mRhiFer1_008174 [Rhinolophus ferrumequinum]
MLLGLLSSPLPQTQQVPSASLHENLSCEAQIVPGDLKPAKSGFPPGEAAWPGIGIDEGASADTQPPAGGTHGKFYPELLEAVPPSLQKGPIASQFCSFRPPPAARASSRSGERSRAAKPTGTPHRESRVPRS